MFSKILVANRGEIALRIMRTARQMGIKTVAVYSDADEDALHVQAADEAVRIGPPPAAESYLRIDRILEAVRSTGADAVHPGYGFLSENAGFAEALGEAGVIFVGPPPAAIAAMGDKIESKRLAAKYGVSTIPGVAGGVEDAEAAVRAAAEIGYPVMIKAAAGGGGKGMRVARDEAEAREGFERSRSEARSSFGDDRIFVEKFIIRPRHIEIQILADSHGNVIHLGERECSVQRRNQKVLEEAPSPFLDAATREAMGTQAAGFARAMGYVSAGTVEFVVDAERNFYFLEMNTRLQVEHPVTELVTGLDLVEQMFRIAAGEKLAIRQEEVVAKGWAVEARVYAEDPFRNFLPSIGRLARYAPPTGRPGIRVDDGVVEGSDIPIFYDPMIGKLCAHAGDRAAALARMRDALDHFTLEGIAHNLPFLAAVIDHPDFVSGNFDTGFIESAYPGGFHGAELSREKLSALAAACLVLRHRLEARAGAGGGCRPGSEWVAEIGGEHFAWEIVEAGGCYRLRNGEGGEIRVEANWQRGRPLCEAVVDGEPLVFRAEERGESFAVLHRGARISVMLRTRRRTELAERMPEVAAREESRALLCPMPGLVMSVGVQPGDEVEAGQALATIEAMKMENVLVAERPAKIARVLVTPGDALAVDDVILEFE